MPIGTMEDLLVHELRDLLSAEKQLTKALPKLVKAASNEELARAFQDHLAETEEQASRLEQCFEILEVSSRGKKCAGMEGLIEEANELVEECEDEDVCDAAIIGAAQRVEHYEMAGYGTARAFAEQLGYSEIVDLLTESLEEEAAADKRLSGIAESRVNAEADEEETATAGGKGGKSGGRGSNGGRQASRNGRRAATARS
jgi:ferritin-like metal-binding protein YciE